MTTMSFRNIISITWKCQSKTEGYGRTPTPENLGRAWLGQANAMRD